MSAKASNPPHSVSVDVARELPWLRRDFGFVKVEDHIDPQSFGNSYAVYMTPDVRLRFARDRGDVLATIASHHRPTSWYILELVCEFVSGQRVDPATLLELGSLIRDHYQAIVVALGPDYFRNESKLEELERRRFQEFWDNLSK